MNKSSRAGVGVIVAGAAALALAFAAPAQAGFSSQLVPISNPAPFGNTVVSDVDVAPNGDALVAWSEGDNVNVISKVRRIRPDGSLGPELTVSDGTQRATSPQIAIAADGRALIAWVENISPGPSSVRARWLAPDDTLGPQLTIRNGGMASDSGELAATALSTGSALVAFHNFSSTPGPFRRVEARRVNPDGSVGGLIFPASGAGSLSVQTVANAAGGALLSWREGDQKAQPVDASDVPGALQTPAASTTASGVMAGDGNDHFQLLYRKPGTPSSIQYQALGADGVGTAEQAIDADTTSANYRIATNAANRSLVLWSDPLSPTQQEINARFIATDGTLEQTTETLTVDTTSTSLGVGVGGSGGGAIAWTETNAAGITSARGRTIAPQASSAPVTLSSATGSVISMRLAVGPTDVGAAAWRETITPVDPASQARIFVRQILPPPVCPNASATIVQGQATPIDLACTGLQLEAPTIVDPPAHGTLGQPDGPTQSVIYTPTPGFDGTDSFTFAGANRGGAGATQTATLTVGKDTVKPQIEKFKITTKRVQFAGRSAASKRRKAAFKLRYSEAATAKIVIERRDGKRKRIGKLKAKAAALSAKVSLKQRIGKRRLQPGTYRASAIAKDLAGNASKPKRLRFTVVRP